MNTAWRIAVTVCTRNRRSLLESCVASIIEADVPPNVQPVLIVIENNATPDCQQLVEDLSRSLAGPWKVIYVQEAVLGIPIARNRSLEVALAENADWIAFIDDDETVDRTWLERMVSGAKEFDCDVLHGPVEFIYPDELPDWHTAKQTRRRPRGTKRRAAATNNTFMKRRLVSADGLALRFDETMRFTGGTDTDFFLRATDLGATIRWVDDAWVRETVEPSRLKMKWHWIRSLRVAANASRLYRKRKGLVVACVRAFSKALLRLVRGAAQAGCGAIIFLITPTQGRKLMFLGVRDLASAAGSVMGLWNIAPEPYKVVVQS